MRNSYNRKTWAGSLQKASLAMLLAGGTLGAAHAQNFGYTPALASNVPGAFTDLGATGTAIATANTDDANSTAQDIGFTFNYNGTGFTQFVLNTNGLMRLGSAAPSSTKMYALSEGDQVPGVDPVGSTAAADVNLLMPFNFDLTAGTGTPEYRVTTTGTAPNRVCTVQWKNVSDKSAASSVLTQFANFTFQAKLYETSNLIEFVYGAATASANTSSVRFPSVGIKGSSAASGQDVLVNKTASTSAWSTSVFITGEYGASAHNFRSTVGPDLGRTYRFAAPACFPPTNLTVSNVTFTTATVTFTVPASGTSSYEVVYGPTGFTPGGAGSTTVTATSSPVTLNGLNPATAYQVYVRSSCTVGGSSGYSSPVAFTTPCNASAAVTTFPYTQNFDAIPSGQSVPCGFTALDANGDGVTWAAAAANPNSGANSMRYRGLVVNNVAANDWFFTPALSLQGTSRYQVAFRYRGEGLANSPSSYTESLEVKSGTAATVAAQTNLLYTNSAITNTSYALANGTSAPAVALLPAGASTQYVGFHVNSTANQGNLYIDDVTVTAVTGAATSEALLRAVSVFPNPSATGRFDLEIHGANAKGQLDVQVTNTLGQRVYAGAARDNYTNQLDLSSLAPGIYYLQVRNGNERMTSQVSIVK